MKKAVMITITIFVTLVLASSVVACSSDQTTSSTATSTATTETLSEANVRAFADPVATSIMEAINEADYDKYVAPANDEFKNAVSEATFEALCTQVTGQLGAFISADYQNWDLTEGYIRVHYRAEFEKSTIGLLVVFDQEHLLTGQFFE